MKLLEEKVAVITGAAQGIGREIAKVLAQNGANIAFTDLSYNDKLSSLEKELSDYGVKAKAYVSDASNFNQSNELIQKVLEDFGKIDVLVNNAGITRDTLLMRMTEEQWDAVINVNLKSVFNMTKAVLKAFLSRRSGCIINISSITGISGNPGQANYAASKAGIIGFTKTIAKELGSRNIRCNAVAPGFILTEMTAQLPDKIKEEWNAKIPLRRSGTPKDVANLVLFLASEEASYITGQIINVCGGLQI